MPPVLLVPAALAGAALSSSPLGSLVGPRPPVAWALTALLVVVLVPVVRIDLRSRRIPNAITCPALVVAVTLGTLIDPGGQTERLLAGVLAAAFLRMPSLVRSDGIGLGDVKLAAVLGVCLGAEVAVALLLAVIAGGLYGVTVAARGGWWRARTATMPFGPCLAVGAVGAWWFGEPLLIGYVGMIAA